MKKKRSLILMLVMAVMLSSVSVNIDADAASKKPSRVSVTSVRASGNKVTVNWKKAKRAQGYQIKLATNSKCTKGVKYLKTKYQSGTITVPNSTKKYYVKVRAYRKSGKRTYYGSWSKVKSVKVVKHTHNWVKKTKTVKYYDGGYYVDKLVKEAWSETVEVPVYENLERSICNGCGKDITNKTSEHMESQMLAGIYKCSGYHSEWRDIQVGTEVKTINHPAEYESVLVPETVKYKTVTYYACSCGATK